MALVNKSVIQANVTSSTRVFRAGGYMGKEEKFHVESIFCKRCKNVSGSQTPRSEISFINIKCPACGASQMFGYAEMRAAIKAVCDGEASGSRP